MQRWAKTDCVNFPCKRYRRWAHTIMFTLSNGVGFPLVDAIVGGPSSIVYAINDDVSLRSLRDRVRRGLLCVYAMLEG